MSEPRLRKRIISPSPVPTGERQTGALDIPALATILVTSEDPAHPVDHLFARPGGKTGRGWVAAEPGEQYLIVEFDQPQELRVIAIEIAEEERARSQELTISISTDGGTTYREILRQEFNFSPPGTIYERENWTVAESGVTNLCVRIVPDKQGGQGRASLAALMIR
ncbi:MAG: discoidin domain-containing protein [Candidatus Binatia bacterium]